MYTISEIIPIIKENFIFKKEIEVTSFFRCGYNGIIDKIYLEPKINISCGVSYDIDNTILGIKFTKNNKPIIYKDLPNFITYYTNGNLHEIRWFYKDWKSYHRKIGPAIVEYNDDADNTIKDTRWYYKNIEIQKNLFLELSTYVADNMHIFLDYNKDQYPAEYNKLMKSESKNMFD